MLPRKIPKKAKRALRWKSPAHCNFVRGHACSVCDSELNIEVAHIRLGSGAGMGQKPDDWFTVSLCKDCHSRQHSIGERSFWDGAAIDPIRLASEFAKSSPKAREIAEAKRDREQ
jgi:hypothetical protein